uniref:Testis specific 13 n=1 Tax=Steinernema glaseri TaxID=37863 RepID=A0A1I8A0U5_9BILA
MIGLNPPEMTISLPTDCRAVAAKEKMTHNVNVPGKSKLNRKNFKNELPEDVIGTKFMEVPSDQSLDFITKLSPGFVDQDHALKDELPVESIMGMLSLPKDDFSRAYKLRTMEPADEYLLYPLDCDLERRQAAFRKNIPWMEKPAHLQDGGKKMEKDRGMFPAEHPRKVIEKSFEDVKKRVRAHPSNKRLIAKYEIPLSFELNEKGEIVGWISQPPTGNKPVTDSLLSVVNSLLKS